MGFRVLLEPLIDVHRGFRSISNGLRGYHGHLNGVMKGHFRGVSRIFKAFSEKVSGV